MCQFCAERCRRLPAARLRLVPPPRPPPLRPTAHRQTRLCCMLLSHGSLARSLAACPRRGSCWRVRLLPRLSRLWRVPLLRPPSLLPRSLPLPTTSPLSRRGRRARPAPARWRPAGSSPTRSATPASASGARPPGGVATTSAWTQSWSASPGRWSRSRCCLPTHRAGRGRRGARRQRTGTSSTRTRFTCT